MAAVFAPDSPSAGRKGSRWRRAQDACLDAGETNGTPCYGCRGRIDYTLRRVCSNHRLAPTVHHIAELWVGGDPYDAGNLAPCHRGCNSRLSNDLRRLLRARGITKVHRDMARVVWGDSTLASRSW